MVKTIVGYSGRNRAINSGGNRATFMMLSSFFTYFEKELKKPGCTLQVLWRE